MTSADVQCELQLPSWMQEDEGMAPVASHESRERQRWRLMAPVLLEAWPRQWHVAYLRDLSQTGLAFLHSEQLFPAERCQIFVDHPKVLAIFGEPAARHVEVARCRYIQEHCYEIGAFLLDPNQKWNVERFFKG